MELTLSEAKTRRKSIKAAATRLGTYLSSPQAAHATKFELTERKNKLVSLFGQYDEIQSRIECFEIEADDANAGNEQAIHEEDRARFEDSYYQSIALYAQRLSHFEQSHIAALSIDNSNNRVLHQGNNTESQIRLPKIELPTFSGAYEDWCTFHDSFDKLIHTNESLTAVQKFHYLRSSLKGRAAEVIKSFDITADNYEEAWRLLSERFDNKRRIIQVHVKAIFDIAPIHRENCVVLRNLLDNVLRHFRALKALQRPVDFWDDMMIHLMLTKLDPVTIKEWETSRSETTIPTFMQLTEFLSKRCQALEAISNKMLTSQPDSSISSNRLKVRNASSHVITSNQACIHCKEEHFVFQCDSFRKLPVERRFKIVKGAHLCLNCLKTRGHQARDCPASSCRKCGKHHNTLLHFDTSRGELLKGDLEHNNGTSNLVNKPSGVVSLEAPLPVVTQCVQLSGTHRVLLSTAIVNVYDSKGRTHGCRVLLDSGSQLNLLTEEMANKLQLKSRTLHMSINGVAEGMFESRKMVTIKFGSRVNAYLDSIDCLLLPKITQRLPQEWVSSTEFKIPSNLQLADPNFNIPADVDLLLGAQVFWQLLCVGQIRACKAHPTLQKTKLGWVVAGDFPEDSCKNTTRTCNLVTTKKLDESISRFWEIENSTNDKTVYHTVEEQACEIHFQQNFRRNQEGRFIVSLPIKKEELRKLGDTKDIAKRRLFALERRLLRRPGIHTQYRNFMREYIELGHMSEVNDEVGSEIACYLPHHAVMKESSTTTKLRVVFDASCKSSSGVALNDVFLIGPTIQDDLFSILARFRTFQYAMSADIAKMYRQILIDETQRPLQRIFWRENPQDDLKIFELNTITYGTSPASFLAIRSLRKLAEEESELYPLGALVVLRDFYVDDMLTGASTLQEALEMKRQTVELLSKAGFELRKWSASDSSLQDGEISRGKAINVIADHGSEIKTLGMAWKDEMDVFKFLCPSHRLPLEKPTKRNILSRIASIFDPLGLVGSSIVIAKMIMQDLWRLKVDWDESIPQDLHIRWREYERKLQALNDIEIPRKVVAHHIEKGIEIHGFSDASQQAYGACIYLRSSPIGERPESHLLCSKSRLAPLKTLSIPRLELCGALLLAQLLKKVQDCLPIKVESVYLWTDSRIVLCWLQTCSRRWTPFVANRVAEIQQITSVDDWRHVAGHENPADLLSRGIMPDQIQKANAWWHGPSWLELDKAEWPSTNCITTGVELPEIRSTVLVATTKRVTTCDIVDNFSRFSRLVRSIAFCFRFVKNCKKKPESTGQSRDAMQSLSNEELEQSELAIVKMVQREFFNAELRALENTECVNKNSNIAKLNPFIDSQGILRVGGRLKFASIPYEHKHPIVLPAKHTFTRLLITHEHERHLHAGAQVTLAAVRQKYWPISARNAIRHIIKKCMKCIRNSPKLSTTLMADLPEPRVNIAKYVFENCGVDYAGPFWYKEGRRKCSKTVKCYVALFVCFATKAVHIELAADLSSETLLNVLKRFISRRGRPANIYSDNGTNFVGAKRELDELYELFSKENVKRDILSFAAHEKIRWSFIPPRAPHMGGLWEAAIKSAKFHLKRIAGEASLRYDELFTLIAQVEAILNSRPLVPLSNDPNDLSALTAGHFLIGCPITSYPEPSLEDLQQNRLSRWQRVEQLKQHFWRRWTREYLHTCQIRNKWITTETPIKIGQMVILREDNSPPLSWNLARVEEVHPSHDDLIRVVTVRTSKGIYKRPITKLCVLPISP